MDFKDKIIICLVVIVWVLAMAKMFHREEPQEPEPANEIIYNVVDVNGDIVGTIKADHLKKCY